MAKSCKVCKFYDKESGDCRRYPPFAQMMPTPERDILTGSMKMGMAKWSVWPQPNKEALDKLWCGEYIAKMESL